MSGVIPWFESTGSIECDLVLDGDVVFVASIDGSVVALDPVTARERWRTALRGIKVQGIAVADGILYATVAFTGRSGPGAVYGLDVRDGSVTLASKARDFISTGPAVADGVVYFGTSHGSISARAGDLFGLDVGTKKIAMSAPGGAWVGTPVVDGNDLLIAAEDETVTRARRADGAVVWKLRTKKFLAGSPEVAGDLVLAGSFDHSLYAADRLTGKLAWRFETGGPLRGTPTVAHGTVYVGSYDECVYAVGLGTGEAKWKYAASSCVLSTATVHDGAVLVGCSDGSVHAIDAETGKAKWTWPGDDPRQRGVIARPLVHGDRLLIASRTGNIHAVDIESGLPIAGARRASTHAIAAELSANEGRVERVEIGAISLASGKIVACDPVTDIHDRALDRTVRPGAYRVFAGLLTANGERRVAWLEVLFSADPPVSWEPAGDAIGVDSGTAAFLSVEAAGRLFADATAEESFGERVEDQMNASYGAGRSWAAVAVVDPETVDAVVSEAGHGDGSYPCEWGMDRKGRVARLRLDFGIGERGAG
ncbi:MAG TPA: PQQ-binding-like beta-propeller repeat protein [Gemmatimonadaceae bacterium]|nr:PQQ-binding-like beta-propeller repeat protein [Gemmatimonadaceae bacterium]